jgi:hypothetical protein
MEQGDERPRANRRELVASGIVILLLLVVFGIVAGGAYLGSYSDRTRWVMAGVGAALVVVGIPLSRTCILCLMGVGMTCIGAGYLVGGLAGLIVPFHR